METGGKGSTEWTQPSKKLHAVVVLEGHLTIAFAPLSTERRLLHCCHLLSQTRTTAVLTPCGNRSNYDPGTIEKVHPGENLFFRSNAFVRSGRKATLPCLKFVYRTEQTASCSRKAYGRKKCLFAEGSSTRNRPPICQIYHTKRKTTRAANHEKDTAKKKKYPFVSNGLSYHRRESTEPRLVQGVLYHWLYFRKF